MKLLINASTLSSTGVTQVAVSFIEECIKHPEHKYVVLMSKIVASQINIRNAPNNIIFIEISGQPRYIVKGYRIRKQIKKIEKEFDPDCVFSIFGPSYWTPKKPHLMGYGYPHYIYTDSPIFGIMSIKERLRIKIYKTIHRYLLRRNGKFYVCETEDVTKRATKYLDCKPKQIFTVSNTYSEYFNRFIPGDIKMLPSRQENEFRFLSLCAFVPHKNLEILNKVIPLLNMRIKGKKIRFVLTVDHAMLQKRMTNEAKALIINLGRIDIAKCPQLYYECDALFLPTLLECLSANYPEAMKMRRPILTSNLPFATTVCKNAALYFDPLNPEDIVDKIEQIIEDKNLMNRLILEGEKQLLVFNSAEKRATDYIAICEDIGGKLNN